MTYQPPPPPGPPQGQPPQPPQPAQQYGAPQQYSPPPAAPAGPPPAGQQWGPPPPAPGYAPAPGYGAAPKAAFDPSTVDKLDWGILGAGFFTLIFSFFDYYTASYGAISASESAWNGFFGWFAALLALAAAGVVAMELFAPQVKLPIPTRLASLGGFALAFLSALLALFIFPESVPSGAGFSTGRGFGYWADLILIIAGGVLAFLRLKATGGKLPWEKS